MARRLSVRGRLPGQWSFSWTALVLAAASYCGCAAFAQPDPLPEFTHETARAYLRSLAGIVASQVGTNAEGYLCLARLESQLGEKAEAERLARKGLEADPARSELAELLANMLIRQDRLEEAAACLRDALKRDPAMKGGCRQLGMVLERLGDREGAQAAFAQAVQQNPRDAGAWLLRGKSLLDQGKLKEAVTDLEKACQLETNLANAYYPLFQAHTKLGNREAAQVALKKFQELKKLEKTGMGVLTDEPMDDEQQVREFTAGVHRETAAILLRRGNAAAAEDHLRRALRITPADADAYDLLGQACVAQGRPADARTNLQEVVRLRPNEAGDRANLGTLLLQLKDYPSAIRELKKALELDPRRPEALHNLAKFYLSSRTELPEALKLSQRLADVAPNAASYDLLGWACYANGKTNEAIAATAEAVRKDPQNTVYSNRLQRLQQLAGGKK